MGGKSEKRVRKRKGDRSEEEVRKPTSSIWIVITVLLALCVFVFAVMSVSATCSIPGNCKEVYLTLFLKPSMASVKSIFPKPSMACMKSMFEVDGIKELSRVSLTKISDLGLFFFGSGFQYLRYVRAAICLKMDSYQSVRSFINSRLVAAFKILNMDLSFACSMMNAAAEVARFSCESLFSKRVLEKFPNSRAENHTIEKLPTNFKAHPNNFAGTMDTYPRDQEGMNEETQRDDGCFSKRKNTLYIFQSIEDQETMNNANDHIDQEYTNSISPISVDDQEHGQKKISEISSSYRIFQLQPREFSWLTWICLLLVAMSVLVLMLLLMQYIQYKLRNKKCTESMILYIHRRKKCPESTEYPKLGSFIDYVDISFRKEGSPKMELKITPVRRSVRIRNKSHCSLVQSAPNFCTPK